MATVNLGRVGLVLKGDWDSATAYVPLDVVSHNGSSWAAKANSTNVEPTTEHSDSWQLLANNAEWVAQVEEYLEQAEQYSEAAVKALANQALGYSDQSTYNVGDYVLYNDVLYICKTAVTTAEAWDSTKWEQTYMADSIGDLILVQPSQPTETANKIWVDSDDETEYQVPTYEEFEEATDDIADLKSAINRLTEIRNPHNLLYGIALTDNKRHEANKQTADTVSGYTMTDLIPVESNTRYALVTDDSLTGAGYGDLGHPAYFAQFAQDKTIILQSNSGYGIYVDIGATTKYVVVSFLSTQLTKNPVFAVAPFTGVLAKPEKEIVDLYKSVSTDEIAFKFSNQQFANLIANHRGSLAKGKILTNGKITANANWMTLTDYIPCEPNTAYNGSILNQTTYNPTFSIAWYTENGTYINNEMHANNTPFTSPATAKFFRISTVQYGSSYTYAEENFDNIFFAATDAPYGAPCIDPRNVFNGIYPDNTMRGKIWVAFGDSITEKNVRSTVNYHDYIRAETGISVVNKGLGGAGYKCRWQNDNNIPALADAFDFTGVDIVTCMAGINDAWTDLTDNMGNADDVYDTSATAQNQSVMACFNHFLDIVIAKAPFAKIGIISPIPCYHTQSGTLYDFNPANDNSTLAQFVEKCKTSCKHHGIPYLDLFHNSGLRPWDITVNAAMFKCNASDSPDGLHPNHLGHRYFYQLVREFVKQLG